MARLLIGIPTRDRPQYLAEALDSVLAQELQDFSIVISDDASAEAAVERVAELLSGLSQERIAYHLQAQPLREYGQGRFLFAQAGDEDYFVILHDDDLLDPSYLATAVARLDAHPELVCFVADPRVFDAEGRRSADLTRDYLEAHGRGQRGEGPVDLLEPMLRWGFVPISGTVFRVSALRRSGFVDAEVLGNYPFELEVLLRLAVQGGEAWYEPRELLGYRYHASSLRVGLWFDPAIVSHMIRLLESLSFEGLGERLRRKLIGSKCRRMAQLDLAAGELAASRRWLLKGLRANPLGLRTWCLALGVILVPFLLRPFVQRWLDGASERTTNG